MSGVLAVVCMGALLAATFWNIVLSRETMEHVWHTLEWLFNTVRACRAPCSLITRADYARPMPTRTRRACVGCEGLAGRISPVAC